jgi:hypothetical protein
VDSREYRIDAARVHRCDRSRSAPPALGRLLCRLSEAGRAATETWRRRAAPARPEEKVVATGVDTCRVEGRCAWVAARVAAWNRLRASTPAPAAARNGGFCRSPRLARCAPSHLVARCPFPLRLPDDSSPHEESARHVPELLTCHLAAAFHKPSVWRTAARREGRHLHHVAVVTGGAICPNYWATGEAASPAGHAKRRSS